MHGMNPLAKRRGAWKLWAACLLISTVCVHQPFLCIAAASETSTPKTWLSGAAARRVNCNPLALNAIARMPNGGRYEASTAALVNLGKAVACDGHRLTIDPRAASPNFCSGGTYLVFLSVIERLHREGRIILTTETARALIVHGQQDGEDVWGRWNANGPGTARLFFELGLGRNFTDFKRARPGDFMKIWWNHEIGSKERGHSVVFLGGAVDKDGTRTVSFWSSNTPDGFGKLTIPRHKVRRAVFSRLERPGRIAAAARLPFMDEYLADMLRRPGSEEEMFAMTGIKSPPQTPRIAAPHQK